MLSIILTVAFIFATSFGKNVDFYNQQSINTQRSRTLLSTTWSVASWSKLPRRTYAQAIGYDSDAHVIWMLGGMFHSNNEQLVSFDVSKWNESDSITDHGLNQLPGDGIYSFGQYFTQNDQYLFLSRDKRISRFNFLTQEYIKYWANFSIGISTYGCLSIVDNYLIVAPEGDNDNTGEMNPLQIYDMFNDIWLSEAPITITIRSAAGCTVHPNNKYLYLFGGSGSGLIKDTIDTIYVGDMHNIMQYNFSTMDATLSAAKYSVRAINYGNDIYIIGGHPSSFRSIDVLNVLTNQIAPFIHSLLLNSGYPAPIVVDYRLYVFGGYNWKNNSQFSNDIWQYYHLEPTTAPTIAPFALTTTAITDTPTTAITDTPTTSPVENNESNNQPSIFSFNLFAVLIYIIILYSLIELNDG